MDQAGELAARLGLPVKDRALLEGALIHGSFTNEHPDEPGGSNERLEFLGDSVVSLVISEALFERHPGEDEGVLTARRAALVSTRALARVAQRLRLDELVVLGQGAERTGERRRASVLAAVFEAVVAAVYLDQGYAATRAWLVALLAGELNLEIPLASLKSPKSRLQELSYVRWGAPPSYRLVSAVGPDHAKQYVVDVAVGARVLGRGEGSNRRDAETEAAMVAIAVLEEAGEAGREPAEAQRAVAGADDRERVEEPRS
ncbi:MAG TPA: ribonuclease III [Candidatus Acidoferrales bacterium]|nr:ribonuclease III [Candidatus Acidoferrales bacterium]